MNNIRATLATVWRIAAPYFRSEDRLAGWTLLAAVIVIELSLVGIDVLLNQWRNRFYNALQERNWDTFVFEIGIFCILAASNVVFVVYQLYLNQWLQIRWRRWMTSRYLGEWLHDSAMSSLTHSKTRKRIAPSPAMTPSTTHIASLTHLYRSSSASNQMTMLDRKSVV